MKNKNHIYNKLKTIKKKYNIYLKQNMHIVMNIKREIEYLSEKTQLNL